MEVTAGVDVEGNEPEMEVFEPEPEDNEVMSLSAPPDEEDDDAEEDNDDSEDEEDEEDENIDDVFD